MSCGPKNMVSSNVLEQEITVKSANENIFLTNDTPIREVWASEKNVYICTDGWEYGPIDGSQTDCYIQELLVAGRKFNNVQIILYQNDYHVPGNEKCIHFSCFIKKQEDART